MRIAFDLDNLLIPYNGEFPVKNQNLLELIFRTERIRKGAINLIKELQAQDHDIWVYTTSLRKKSRIYWQFRLNRINLGGVVNHQRHCKELGNKSKDVSKYPPAFNIDLLIDDSKGVFLEGEKYGFKVLLIKPEDLNWVNNIKTAVLY